MVSLVFINLFIFILLLDIINLTLIIISNFIKDFFNFIKVSFIIILLLNYLSSVI